MRNPWAGLLLAAAAFLPARAAADTCDQNFNFINPSSWWGGAFGNCKRPGGPTDPEQVFECAYDQVDQNRKSQCLYDKLRASPQTSAGIDAVIANNAPLNDCNRQFALKNGSNWWWGAFGNCKKQGGPTDATAIFECAWAQVPVNETSQCLHDRLRQTDQTRRAIDEVAANNAPPPPPATAPDRGTQPARVETTLTK